MAGKNIVLLPITMLIGPHLNAADAIEAMRANSHEDKRIMHFLPFWNKMFSITSKSQRFLECRIPYKNKGCPLPLGTSYFIGS